MSDLRPLEIGEKVLYRESATVYAAIVLEDLDDGVYRIEYMRLGVYRTGAAVNRLDLYAREDRAALIEDLRGLADDANETAEEIEHEEASAV